MILRIYISLVITACFSADEIIHNGGSDFDKTSKFLNYIN